MKESTFGKIPQTQWEQTLEYLNEIFRSGQFQQSSASEKNAIIDRLLEHPLIQSNGITGQEMIGIYQNIMESSDAFSRLSRDPLFLILQQSKPEDVISLCQTTPKYAHLCRNEGVFAKLLDMHFGMRFLDDSSAKNQYLELAATESIPFQANIAAYLLDASNAIHDHWPASMKAEIVLGRGVVNQRLLETQRVKAATRELFNVEFSKKIQHYREEALGLPVNNYQGLLTGYKWVTIDLIGSTIPTPGTKVWVAYGIHSRGYYLFAARSKVTIAHFIIQKYGDIVNELRKAIVHYGGNIPYNSSGEEQLDYALQRYFKGVELAYQMEKNYLVESLIPFTPEAVLNHIMTHDDLLMGSNEADWIFFQVEF